MNKTKLLFVLALSVVLSACGGDGSGGVPEPRPSGSVSGVAFDGLIMNGNVNVYGWDGSKGELLGSGKTDTLGEYSIDLDGVPSQPVLIEVTGGRYTEEASGRNVALFSGDFLYALQDYEQGDAITTSLTFYTTIATGLAEHMVRTGVSPSVAIRRANDAISDLIGISIRETKPLEINNPSNATPVVTDGHLYGFATASISELTKWISLQNDDGKPAHEEYNSIKFAAAAYSDISADGLLDGRGLGGVVAQGVVRLTPEIYRTQIATNMLVIANSKANLTRLEPTDVLPMAKAYSENNSSMFAGAEITPLDAQTPILTNISHVQGEVVAGTITLSADVSAPVGLDEVSLYINGTLHEYVGADSSPEWTIDTMVLDEGLNDFEIYASNIIGGEIRETIKLMVSNAGTTISDIFPADQSSITGLQTFTARVADPVGIKSINFILDGAIYPIAVSKTPARQYKVTEMVEGSHTLVVEVTNSVGTVTTKEVTFRVDNTEPVASWNLQNTKVMSETESIEATVTDNEEVIAAELYINGVLLDVFTDFPINRSVNTRDFTEGEKSIVLEAWDEAGNRTTLERSVLFDSTPPTLSINSPAAGTSYSGDIPVQINTYDAVGIEKLQVFINGSLFKSLSVDQHGNASTTIPAANYNNGTYSVMAKVTDKAGYTAQSASSVGFFAQPPKLEITHQYDKTASCRECAARSELSFQVSNAGPNGAYQLHKVEAGTGGKDVTTHYTSSFKSDGSFSFSKSCDNRLATTRVFTVKDANGLVSAPLSVVMACP